MFAIAKASCAFILSQKASAIWLFTDFLSQARLGRNGFSFGDLIPLLLADNGTEFTNIAVFENTLDGKKETMLFFAKPYCSSDKPHVEKNHTLLRDILPKGTSFDNLTQDDVNLIMSHVNGVIRKDLHGKSAYDVFTALFPDSLAKILGVSFVPSVDVIQSPALMKGKLRAVGNKI